MERRKLSTKLANDGKPAKDDMLQRIVELKEDDGSNVCLDIISVRASILYIISPFFTAER